MTTICKCFNCKILFVCENICDRITVFEATNGSKEIYTCQCDPCYHNDTVNYSSNCKTKNLTDTELVALSL